MSEYRQPPVELYLDSMRWVVYLNEGFPRVKYIRADQVDAMLAAKERGHKMTRELYKEREERLIRAAIDTTTERFRPDLDASDFMEDSDIDDAYKEAGLEKLE